ncbi:MAG TPA: acetyl-CoA carboxylase biotin carboxylase subunit [Candidatus Binatia bacterium]|nr:acetyl-CoA carboxylase biotin carboxylase subunit [Candidatus Binatia bacterium]
MSKLPRKVLIANRGEIALRIIRTVREMGIATVAVYSEADRDALHVRRADEAYFLGPAQPAQSYLDAERLLDVARCSSADAIHPGYGFLAENAAFARAVEKAGLIWVGPHAGAIEAMGDKLRSREVMRAAGVPIVPGGTEPLGDLAAARAAAQTIGFPLALKASGGGGGKGLRVARTLDEIESAFATARREAVAYFKDSTIYAERYLDNPKHVELQILADKHGNVLHVGERDCSLQRRHQKVWEEAPALVPKRVRRGLREAGLRAARAIGYDNVGTIEFLVTGDEFYFLEMNTRIQVEHPVSESISGLDLIREQIRAASGERLGFEQDDIEFRGHAIEVRINAEDPARGFAPAPGMLRAYREPGGPGVRVDSAAFAGWTISAAYDSLVAKLIVWGPNRERALARLRRACDEFEIEGIPTTLPLARALADYAPVLDASFGTATLEPFAAALDLVPFEGEALAADGTAQPTEMRVEVNGKLFRVRLVDAPRRSSTGAPRPARRSNTSRPSASGNAIVAPMHGVVADVLVTSGASVEAGQVVVVVEAMKMMNELRAHRAGTIERVAVERGATVEAGTVLLTFA